MDNNDQLKKSLGLTDVFCIAVGAMISAGIFLLPGEAFGHIGPAIIFSYTLGGVLATMGIFAVLELATAMPQTGGIYYFTTRSLGPLAGIISGVLNWSALSLKSAFAIFGTAQIIHDFWPIADRITLGVAITVLFLTINLLSTTASALIEKLMVYFLLAIMVLYVALGVPHVDVARYSPMFLEGRGAPDILKQAGFIFVAFGGLLGVISVSEEIRNPRRSIPVGILTSLLVVTILYTLVMLVTVGTIAPAELMQSHAPLADSARLHYGRGGYVVLTIGALLAFVTTGNAGIMGAARYPMALARDKLMPGFFAQTMGRDKVPIPALLFTGAVMIAVQFFDLESLVSIASTVVMLSYIITNLSVIILRESGILNYRPSFKTPLYPVMPILCILIFSVLIFKLGNSAHNVTFLIILGSVVLYFVYGRKVNRETAFMHLLAKITKSRLDSHELEHELKEVVMHRDEIEADSFDLAVENAYSVIIADELPLHAFLDAVSAEIAPRLGMDAAALSRTLYDREAESSTVISPSVAVPHITVPDTSGLFVLAIVKSVPGVVFQDDIPPLNTIVFLFASPDRRSNHLRGLAVIAQTILSRNFEPRWERAKTPQQLKDIFHLSHRNRGV